MNSNSRDELKKRAWIFRYLRERIGLDAHAYEFYQFQSECRNKMDESVARCEECHEVVKNNQPFEWVGIERISHQKCNKLKEQYK